VKAIDEFIERAKNNWAITFKSIYL
jgi:hypothetical protein